MGRRSQFTPAQKRDAVLAVLAKTATVSEVCRGLGITEPTFTRWRQQAIKGIEQALEDRTKTSGREHALEKKLLEARRSLKRLEVENDLLSRSVAASDVGQRTALGRTWMAEGVAPVATIAKVLSVSRQALYKSPRTPTPPDDTSQVESTSRDTAESPSTSWSGVKLRPENVELDLAIRITAQRHPSETKREITARLRRKGYDVSRKIVARVLEGIDADGEVTTVESAITREYLPTPQDARALADDDANKEASTTDDASSRPAVHV